MKHLVIGILAHVDSGKTTLSEALLYHAGEIRTLGRVDHRDAFLDTDVQERDRGITIFSKQAELHYGDTDFTLLDTPGHVDFSPEAERTLQVLDCAILVISGTDGVQSHTDTLWRLLKEHNIPVFLFINKMDLVGADHDRVMSELSARFGDGFADFTDSQFSDESAELIGMASEALMEDYLSGSSFSDSHIAEAVTARRLFPCVFGSALKLVHTERILTCIDRFMPMPEYPEIFGARVFKITRDGQGNRLTHLKLMGGMLKVRTPVRGFRDDGSCWSEKPTELRIYSGAKYTQVQELTPGMICAAAGLGETRAGMGLGCCGDADTPELQSVLSYEIILLDKTNINDALDKLRLLEEEEPQLHIVWDSGTKSIRVQLMGTVQKEILKNLILSRFGIVVDFAPGKISYRETIKNTVEGVGHFEPLRHYAEVHLLLEPGKQGSGLVFDTQCDEDRLDRNWQRLILTHLNEKVHRGVLTGAPITDMKITLMDGKAHVKHTEGGDFRQATYRAVRQGLMQAESVLLEPWYKFRLSIPTDYVGRAMSDLQRMGGQFTHETYPSGVSILSGRAPVRQLQEYSTELIGYTRGLGQLSCSFGGYFPCENQETVIAETGYQPEADLANTADSVFCSHGSGEIIPWNEVAQHMHLPSCLSPVKEEPEERTWEVRAREYCRQVATDKELMAIFERTYGPIRKDPCSAMHTRKDSVSTSAKPKMKPSRAVSGPEYLLVDGYNIIFAWDELAELARDSLETARSQLIHRMCNYHGMHTCELILVFDAYRVKGNPGSIEDIGGIHVVYTKEAETADMYIERATHELGSGKKVKVATSDGAIQMIILGHGALRIPASEFHADVLSAEARMRDYLEHQND